MKEGGKLSLGESDKGLKWCGNIYIIFCEILVWGMLLRFTFSGFFSSRDVY